MATTPGMNIKRLILTSKAVKPIHNSSAGFQFSGCFGFNGCSSSYKSQAQRICISVKIDHVL